jgi:hypothetical protein
MRWVWLLALAAVATPTSSFAQSDSSRVYGGFRFGMTVDEARAVNPSLQEDPRRGADLVLLRGGSPATIAGFSFSPSLAFRYDRLKTVSFAAAGLVRDGAQCGDALLRVVTALEPTMGAFSGPPSLDEYGAPSTTRSTPTGSTVRFYDIEAAQNSIGFANQRNAGWVEVSSSASPYPRSTSGEWLCEIDLQFRETLPPIFEPLQPPTAEQLAAAEFMEGRPWAVGIGGDEFEMTMPRIRWPDRAEVVVPLDCLVMDRGALNCVVVEEAPGGRWFGEMALRLSRFYRVDETRDGVTTLGRRVRPVVRVTVRGAAEAISEGEN